MGMLCDCTQVTQEIVEGVAIMRNGPEYGERFSIDQIGVTQIEPVQTMYGDNVQIIEQVQRAGVDDFHRSLANWTM